MSLAQSGTIERVFCLQPNTAMGVIVLILMIVLSIVMVIFGVQNPQPVNVRFFTIESGNISLSLVIVVSALLGAALIGLLSLWDGARRGLRSMRTTKRLTSLEQQNVELERLKASLEQENAALKERNDQLENVKQTIEVQAIDSDGMMSDR
ncbi:MAG: DUF1049 domain-containing protein [Tildeniella nuda ZEHNDER 1965/U140]|jgi:uncharacterized integral membrane protein|nr:DUF1049 domain-containing protein [Tildeniella nuda ZEHNDER 1965/U140]